MDDTLPEKPCRVLL